jgi:hypothetical protein
MAEQDPALSIDDQSSARNDTHERSCFLPMNFRALIAKADRFA